MPLSVGGDRQAGRQAPDSSGHMARGQHVSQIRGSDHWSVMERLRAAGQDELGCRLWCLLHDTEH